MTPSTWSDQQRMRTTSAAMSHTALCCSHRAITHEADLGQSSGSLLHLINFISSIQTLSHSCMPMGNFRVTNYFTEIGTGVTNQYKSTPWEDKQTQKKAGTGSTAGTRPEGEVAHMVKQSSNKRHKATICKVHHEQTGRWSRRGPVGLCSRNWHVGS